MRQKCVSSRACVRVCARVPACEHLYVCARPLLRENPYEERESYDEALVVAWPSATCDMAPIERRATSTKKSGSGTGARYERRDTDTKEKEESEYKDVARV